MNSQMIREILDILNLMNELKKQDLKNDKMTNLLKLLEWELEEEIQRYLELNHHIFLYKNRMNWKK